MPTWRPDVGPSSRPSWRRWSASTRYGSACSDSSWSPSTEPVATAMRSELCRRRATVSPPSSGSSQASSSGSSSG